MSEKKQSQTQSKNKRKAMEAKIIEKARADKEFKKELLANPASALKKLFGFEVPENVKISVLEEKADHLYIVLPVNPEDIEIPADMLKKVAGGVCGCDCDGGDDISDIYG